MGSVRVLAAPAKVNLHLEVLGRRADGFHEILSLFQAVSLCDRLRLRSLKQAEALSVRCTVPIAFEHNIVTAAVRLFRRTTGLSAGVEVSLEKRIPIGAGLGGGSSDAAATLRGLNAMYGHPLEAGRLLQLAARLGSDVPFFLGSSTALVSGRGELLRAIPGRRDYRLVLVWPGFEVATREAYAWLDERQRDPAGCGQVSAAELERRYRSLPPAQWGFFNSFQPVVAARYPVIAELTESLRRAGAEPAGVSGCGSAVFGVFVSRRAALRAAARARGVYSRVEVVSPLQIRAAEG